MNLFRRSSQKQYDGPATSAINYQSHAAAANAIDGRRDELKRYNSSSRNHHPGPTRQNMDRHQSSRDKKKKNTPAVDRNTPLASGISSRRTSQKVRNHLPARVMSPAAEKVDGSGRSGGSGIPASISLNNNSDREGQQQFHQNGAQTSSRSGRERKPQMPMEHDGGVLCLCAVPPPSTPEPSNSNRRDEYNHIGSGGGRTHRFLSGGADGTIKLWAVHEPQNDANAKLMPRLVRTYSGHSGYVHCIAVLGTFSDNTEGSNTTAKRTISSTTGFMRRKSRDSLNLLEEEDEEGEEGDHHEHENNVGSNSRYYGSNHRRLSNTLQHLNKMPSMPSIKRPSNLSLDSSNNSRGNHARKDYKRRKRLLFVSASRDNTLRIWPIDDATTNINDPLMDNANFLEDESERSCMSRDSSSDDPLLTKGVKLRGHQFGKDNIGGVLCVCAVPSLPSSCEDNGDDFNHGNNGFTNNSDTTAASGNNTISAGQFCSGGSDGRIRVFDVQSAMSLKKPRSGMYATVQLQCIDPPEPTYHSNGHSHAAPVTSLVCTHNQSTIHSSSNHSYNNNGMESVSLFAGDASGTIRRYGRMNECGAGHVNNAIWWGCTGIFAGHCHPITSVAVLSSKSLMPLLCPHVELDDGDYDEDDDDDERGNRSRSGSTMGTMLVSSCEDGWVRVWDAFDARITSMKQSGLDTSERSHDEYALASGRVPRRKAMWEIELNDSDNGGGGGAPARNNNNTGAATHSTDHQHIGVTSLATLQSGVSMAAGTTDGAIRMWNVSSGLYEGAYNLGKAVQIWSLGVLAEREVAAEDDEDDEGGCGKNASVGIIVSGDNRGRIRVLRKVSSR